MCLLPPRAKTQRLKAVKGSRFQWKFCICMGGFTLLVLNIEKYFHSCMLYEWQYLSISLITIKDLRDPRVISHNYGLLRNISEGDWWGSDKGGEKQVFLQENWTEVFILPGRVKQFQTHSKFYYFQNFNVSQWSCRRPPQQCWSSSKIDKLGSGYYAAFSCGWPHN